jgi:hypothetical protein
VLIVIAGTFVALTPNMTAAFATSRSRVPVGEAPAMAMSKGGD